MMLARYRFYFAWLLGESPSQTPLGPQQRSGCADFGSVRFSDREEGTAVGETRGRRSRSAGPRFVWKKKTHFREPQGTEVAAVAKTNAAFDKNHAAQNNEFLHIVCDWSEHRDFIREIFRCRDSAVTVIASVGRGLRDPHKLGS